MTGRRGFSLFAALMAGVLWLSVLGGVPSAVAKPLVVPTAGGRVEITDPRELEQTRVAEVRPVRDSAGAVAEVKGRAPSWPGTGESKMSGMAAGAAARPVLGQPMRVGLAKGSKVAGDITVRGESRETVEKMLGTGLGTAWTVSGPVGATVDVAVDYSSFASAAGAGWSSRLGLVLLPACAATTPEKPECQTATPVTAANDQAAQTVSAQVTLASAQLVVAAAAATTTTGGGTGSFAQTSLSASSTWVGGAGSGAFTWSYPLAVPPAAGGLEPSLAISYDSNIANGRVGSTNNQSSWVGEGFELASGFIERKYAACSDEAGDAGSNNATKTGDLCWGIDNAVTHDAPWDNATLNLAGHSGDLVRVGSTAQWRLRVDDGTRIEKIGAAGSAAESWKVTTTDGTQYFFGKSTVNGIATNSVWKVPVAGNDKGEPGHNSDFGSSFSTVAWRWNLDSVVAPTGDSMTYLYKVETNKYNKNLKTATSYDRGGYLSEIHYGERSGSESASPAGKVTFTVAERCYTDASLSDCETATPTAQNATHWPDVPVDAICTGSTCSTTQISPTFFTRKRLARVDTFMAGTNVDRWTLSASFPDPGDNSPAALWPTSIQRKGMSGTALTLPAVTLTPTMKANRITNLSAGSPLTRPRLGQITTESGGRIIASYSGPSTCSSSVAPASNTQQCFPAYYSEGGAEPTKEWFNQWVLASVAESDTAVVVDQNAAGTTSSAQAKRTTYTYGGGGAWRYDDSPLTPKKYRTWNIWRGFGTVTTAVGDAAMGNALLVTQSTFYRGMHGDKAASGTKTVKVTDSTGASVDDLDWFAGMTREVRTLKAVGGAEITGQVDDRWVSGTKANDGHRQAKVVGTSETRTRQAISSGTRTTRTTIQARNSDELPTQTEATGDAAVTGDETCTRTSYAATNTTAWIVGRVAETSVMPALCATAADLTKMVSDVKHYYDGSTTLGAVPSKGLETRTDTIAGSTTRSWATSQASYDQHGRVLTATDALGNTTTTSYTPATGSPVTAVKTVSADPDGTGPLTAQTTTTTIDPKWGVPTKQVDPGGQTTTATLDALGRVTAVWAPGRDASASASAKYTYAVNQSGVNAVKTETLKADGASYQTSFTLYDSLLRMRQTQTQAANTSGRVIKDTQYDARGLAWRTLTYWGDGNPSAVMVEATPTSAVPFETRVTYDFAARPTAEAFWSYGTELWRTSTSYTGEATTVVPPAGGTPTTTITDVQGRTTALIQHLGTSAASTVPQSKTTYTYDTAGQLTKVVDPKNNTWTYTYDVQGNRLTSNDPDKGLTTNTYDLLGHQLTSKDARGKGVAVTYDKLYRVTKTADLAGNELTTTSWDTVKAGLVAQTTRKVSGSQIVSKVNSYDNAGRVTSASLVVPTVTGIIPAQLAGTYTTTTSYNPDGSTNTVGLPATGPVPAETLAYTYTATNLPNAMTGTPTGGTAYPYENGTTYTPLGEVQWLKMGVSPYNSQVKFDYDLSTRRLSVMRHYLNTTQVEQAAYSYTNSGLITSQTTQPQTGAADTQCYSYDYQQQLTQAWTPASNSCAAAPTQAGLGGPAPYWTTWTTDTIGKTSQRVDRTATTSSTTNFTYNSNGSARPHFVTATSGTAGNKAYAADPAGNTTSRPNGAATQALTWDDEGKLATIANGSTTIQTNIYGVGGERLIRAESGRTTLYVAGTELTFTTASAKTTANRMYTFAGQTIASRSGAANSAVTTLVPDRQGTTHQQVNTATGGITTAWQGPYGVNRTSPAGWVGERGFVGGAIDAVSALVHIGARDYDTVLGRFVTTDPLFDLGDPLNFNAYLYADNSPVTKSDPTGLKTCDGNCTTGDYLGTSSGAVPFKGTTQTSTVIPKPAQKPAAAASSSSSALKNVSTRGYVAPTPQQVVKYYEQAVVINQVAEAVAPYVNMVGDGLLALTTFEGAACPFTVGLSCAAIPPTGGGALGVKSIAVVLGTSNLAKAAEALAKAKVVARAAEAEAAVAKANVGSRALVDAGKYDYFFGRVVSDGHNAARSAQNAQQLARIGVYDNAAGRSLLSKHFDEVVARNDNVARTFTNAYGTFQVRDSLFNGPGGFLKFESTWQVTDDGFRLTTMVPVGGPR